MTDVVERARAALDPNVSYLNFRTAQHLIADLLAEVERLRASEWAARGERDSMKRRLDLLTADESWWVGGAWGDYGEGVIPVRAVHMVLGEKMAGAPELDPGLAATYRDLRATVESQAEEIERLRQQCSTIETVWELDTLPHDTIILLDGCALQKRYGTWYWANDDSDDAWSSELEDDLPARVLWLPEWGNA